jgi:hypothetical protein
MINVRTPTYFSLNKTATMGNVIHRKYLCLTREPVHVGAGDSELAKERTPMAWVLSEFVLENLRLQEARLISVNNQIKHHLSTLVEIGSFDWEKEPTLQR